MTVTGQLFSVERMLFATDFSAASNNVASYARTLARRFSSSPSVCQVLWEAIVSRTDSSIAISSRYVHPSEDAVIKRHVTPPVGRILGTVKR
jgi:hypothetical protein